MRKLITYRIIAAYSLVAILALPIGMQTWHHLTEEHQPQVHCDGEHGQIHLHDQSYAFDHCFLCTYHFSQYTGQINLVEEHVPGWNLEKLLTEKGFLLPQRNYSNQSSRAPPALV